MVAADSSTLIAFLSGAAGADIDLLTDALRSGSLALSPVVLTEVLSEKSLTRDQVGSIQKLPILEILEGYWVRAAFNRAKVISLKLRARLPDTLIAQSCLDHKIALLTRDGDFRHFARHCGLKLA